MSSHPTFTWRRSTNKPYQKEIWLEYFCIIGLLLAALGLFLINLGSLPLSNEEAILARIASEIYNSSSGLKSWIFPTFWGEPVLDRPPLIYNSIALSYSLFGVSEFTTRLPGALFSAISVLIVYKIGREIFIARLPALFSASIYLTFLPVVRLGRLATFEGGLLCLEILTIWAILRSRRNLRWALIAGIALGAIALSNGIQSLSILTVALVFLCWDTPRLFGSVYLWLGIVLGIAPSLFWYAAQWYRYQEAIALYDLWRLLLEPIRTIDSVAERSVVSYFVWLQYFFPWSVVIFTGLQLVRQNLHWGWSKLIAAWTGVATLAVLLIANRQYWYILPLCPALALAGGIELERVRNLPSYVDYPRLWSFSLGIMTISIAVAGLYGKLQNQIDFYLASLSVALVITLGMSSLLIFKRNSQFVSLLFWGLYVSLFIFISSPYWIWEQATFEPIKPITALIQQHVPQGEIVYTSDSQDSSALSFYSQHRVVFLNVRQLKQRWADNSAAYLLLDKLAVDKLNLPPEAISTFSDIEHSWFLAIKNPKS